MHEPPGGWAESGAFCDPFDSGEKWFLAERGS